jgi:hypothetical protein
MLVITTDLRTDGSTEPRGRLEDAVVQRYAEDMEGGLWDFARSSSPITAFFDGESYWLADGFHRVTAAEKAPLDEIDVDVRQGGQRDAILYSVSANATHGYPRSNDDKRRAVSRLLDDAEWAHICATTFVMAGGRRCIRLPLRSQGKPDHSNHQPANEIVVSRPRYLASHTKWSDREIARLCHVDHRFVGRLRKKLTGDIPSDGRTYKTKHGTVATMNTSAIGSNSKPLLPQAPPRAQSEGHRREPVAAESTDDPCSSDVVAVPVGTP